MKSSIFISYVREDLEVAKRLFWDLRYHGLNAWLDVENLLPGESWKLAIRKQIQGCSHFLALLSQRSLSKRGFHQNEVKTALEILPEIPDGQIFLIPVRLEPIQPAQEPLRDLQWVDLFPSYEEGFERLLRSVRSKKLSTSEESRTPLVSGLWVGRTGRLRLRQQGSEVSGDYDWKGQEYAGHLRGVIEGTTLRFEWSWDFTSETGEGIFQIRQDQQRLEGEWYLGGKDDSFPDGYRYSDRWAFDRAI